MKLQESNRSVSRPKGLTLLELVIVLSICGVIVSLVLVGVQHVREQSRRTDCANRLRQLGLGIQLKISASGYLPDSTTETMESLGIGGTRKVRVGPIIQSLRFSSGFEQSFSVDLAAHGGDLVDPALTFREPVEGKLPSLVVCPSNAEKFGISYRANIGSNEIGSSLRLKSPDLHNGPFGDYVQTRASQVSRGLSHVAGFSECIPGRSRFRTYAIYFPHSRELGNRSELWDQTCREAARVEDPVRFLGMASPPDASNWYQTYYSHRTPPNSKFAMCYCGKELLTWDIGITATSSHADGVNCCFLDGSVRFFGSSTEEKVWKEISVLDANF